MTESDKEVVMSTLLGKKLGMTQVWSENDQLVPVTVLQVGPCVVTQIKTNDKEGYEAIQIGFGAIKPSKVNQPMQGHFAAAGVEPQKVLREVRVDSAGVYELGQQLTVEDFAEAKKVHVTGISKGKGFAGVIKRHNFRGGPGGHGAHFHRAPGSIGQCATPSRVFKGLKLPGHMGTDKVTVKNLEVVKVDAEQNLLLVKGAVPGGKNALVSVRTA
ncbi:MAG: 50S ribosomal protein L3 [Coriobacteriales bacterium]|nr:50S ribosomal protein L3 [Coriobacteriales bacterium]